MLDYLFYVLDPYKTGEVYRFLAVVGYCTILGGVCLWSELRKKDS